MPVVHEPPGWKDTPWLVVKERYVNARTISIVKIIRVAAIEKLASQASPVKWLTVIIRHCAIKLKKNTILTHYSRFHSPRVKPSH
jgi:hypothetical protein